MEYWDLWAQPSCSQKGPFPGVVQDPFAWDDVNMDPLRSSPHKLQVFGPEEDCKDTSTLCHTAWANIGFIGPIWAIRTGHRGLSVETTQDLREPAATGPRPYIPAFRVQEMRRRSNEVRHPTNFLGPLCS